MRIVKSIAPMDRLARDWKRRNVRVALVPTMGYLHAGHLSLVTRARRIVGLSGQVVLSIYVNPTQFGPTEDLARYPRDLRRDVRMCHHAGVDVVFAPTDREMYPGKQNGTFSTCVVEEALSRRMEGASRPTHFRGVTTIVAKLFHIIQPQWAVFGQKDYQQAAIIRRMIRDLNFPVKIILAPTCREPDGLAMSSRNKFLQGDLRSQAVVLWHSLQQAQARVRAARRPIPAAQLKTDLKEFIERQPAARLDYVELFDPLTLAPVSRVNPGVHLALAVFIGETRLIDNLRL